MLCDELLEKIAFKSVKSWMTMAVCIPNIGLSWLGKQKNVKTSLTKKVVEKRCYGTVTAFYLGDKLHNDDGAALIKEYKTGRTTKSYFKHGIKQNMHLSVSFDNVRKEHWSNYEGRPMEICFIDDKIALKRYSNHRIVFNEDGSVYADLVVLKEVKTLNL